MMRKTGPARSCFLALILALLLLGGAMQMTNAPCQLVADSVAKVVLPKVSKILRAAGEVFM
jgi:hypothetical protein